MNHSCRSRQGGSVNSCLETRSPESTAAAVAPPKKAHGGGGRSGGRRKSGLSGRDRDEGRKLYMHAPSPKTRWYTTVLANSLQRSFPAPQPAELQPRPTAARSTASAPRCAAVAAFSRPPRRPCRPRITRVPWAHPAKPPHLPITERSMPSGQRLTSQAGKAQKGSGRCRSASASTGTLSDATSVSAWPVSA